MEKPNGHEGESGHGQVDLGKRGTVGSPIAEQGVAKLALKRQARSWPGGWRTVGTCLALPNAYLTAPTEMTVVR
jgi:hypothetical protein